ncbi:MAG: Rne/Rng family ribonuclease [Thermoanaerobaculia bacterium]
MRREILVSVTPPETRVALTEDGRAVEVFHERRRRQGFVGNIYKGRVHRVLPGMHAAFVKIGLDRDAFLYVEDAVPRPIEDAADDTGDDMLGRARSLRAGRPRIDDILKEGQEIVVQVTKDPLQAKGPRVTTNLSLPGRTLVYLPGLAEAGVSRRITGDAERERLRQILESFGGEGGFIARTAAEGAASSDFEADRRYLTELSSRIARKAETAAAPALLHRELDLALRVVRDAAPPDLESIRVDDSATAGRIAEFLRAVAPGLAARIEPYQKSEPLFEAFGVEAAIANALQDRVALDSGGSIVIQQTEALVAIDINTGRFVGKDELEETVFATNLEAVPEVARQIRLRDLGGLLVVDFIDMEEPEHRLEVFERFEAELARDRARTRVLQISDFGLVEITRQRSRRNLERVLTRPCPECDGSGRVPTDLTAALELRRALVAGRAAICAGNTIRIRVHPTLARLLIEEDPDLLSDVEESLAARIELNEDDRLAAAGWEILPD